MRDDSSYEIPNNIVYKVTSSRVKLSLWKKNRYLLHDLHAIINSFQPSVIHSHLFEAEMLSRAILKKNIVYISHIHDNITQLAPFKTNAKLKRKISDYYELKWILRRYRKAKNHFISISSDTTRFLQNVLPNYFLSSIFSLSNSIDFNRFYLDSNRILTKDKIRLISVGSLVAKKNQYLLIEIATLLKKNEFDFEFLILGDGPDRIYLEEEIAVRGLTQCVHLLGSVNDVTAYLHKATFFIHSAVYEPFGLVLLEAMAAGLPVISLDGGGNRDIIVDGKNGFLIQENRANLFVEKIQHLLSHPSQYNTMSIFAQHFAKQYDMPVYLDQLIEFYHQCLDKK
jgi:glycosyltransferase involved in cell wall biosynthesis